MQFGRAGGWYNGAKERDQHIIAYIDDIVVYKNTVGVDEKRETPTKTWNPVLAKGYGIM